jgi:hypothetical protein
MMGTVLYPVVSKYSGLVLALVPRMDRILLSSLVIRTYTVDLRPCACTYASDSGVTGTKGRKQTRPSCTQNGFPPHLHAYLVLQDVGSTLVKKTLKTLSYRSSS